MASKGKEGMKVVAAIDFGTTYSGFAYAFSNDPDNIIINDRWEGGASQLQSQKIPTSLLVDKHGKRDSFGYLAEDRFVNLCNDDKLDGHMLFRRFKMALNNLAELSALTKVQDVTGKHGLEASKLFTMSIEYLKDEILKPLKKKNINQSEIHFVLTVPAIWTDKAKHLMRMAAYDAGIKNEQLTLALESEVASIWCRKEAIDMAGKTITQMGKGTKYMLVDIGGGTADIAIHTVEDHGDIRADAVPAGGAIGGENVDKTILSVFENNILRESFKKFRQEHQGEYYELLREIELKKRQMSDNEEGVKLDMPGALIQLGKEQFKGKLEERFSQSEFAGLTLTGQKLKMDYQFSTLLFDYSINSLMGEMETLCNKHPDIKVIVVVGGFADCKFVRNAIESKFKKYGPFFPKDSTVVVVKGAVVYGQHPRVVRSRKAHFTYGFQAANDKFQKLVTVGQSLTQDFVVTEVITPPSADIETMEYSLYSSTDENPQKVTERTCARLHTFFIRLPQGKTVEQKKFERSVIFGDTELMFRTKDLATGKEHVEYLSFK